MNAAFSHAFSSLNHICNTGLRVILKTLGWVMPKAVNRIRHAMEEYSAWLELQAITDNERHQRKGDLHERKFRYSSTRFHHLKADFTTVF